MRGSEVSVHGTILGKNETIQKMASATGILYVSINRWSVLL